MFPITAKNTGTTVLPNVKLPPPTTVSTVPPSASLISVKSTGTIVRASVRSLPEIIAGTERRQYPLVRVTPVVLITPIVRPKSAAGLANQVIQSQVTAALKTIRLVLRITVQKEPGFLDAPAMIPAQAAEGVIISVISAGETEPAPLAAAAARTEAQWALTPVDKLSNFQKTRDNHKQSPSFEGLVFIIRVRL